MGSSDKGEDAVAIVNPGPIDPDFQVLLYMYLAVSAAVQPSAQPTPWAACVLPFRQCRSVRCPPQPWRPHRSPWAALCGRECVATLTGLRE
eukprot:COSAG01_NODE_7647_length_3115_cov_1.557692_3_plen_91_part_00